MGHVFGRLFQEIVGVNGIRSDDFIGGNADAKVIVLRVAAKGSDHDMLRQKTGTAALGQGDVDEWNNYATEIKDAHEICRREGNLGHQRPVEYLFDVENGEAETLAT